VVELALILFSGVSFILGVFVGVSEERRRNTKVASSASANKPMPKLPLWEDVELACDVPVFDEGTDWCKGKRFGARSVYVYIERQLRQ
jgi:hypothetical protein